MFLFFVFLNFITNHTTYMCYFTYCFVFIKDINHSAFQGKIVQKLMVCLLSNETCFVLLIFLTAISYWFH